MKNRKGFTLVEMMCVVAIIIFLSGVTFAGFSQYSKRAKDLKASVNAHSAAYASQDNQIRNLLMTTRAQIQHPTTDTQPHYNPTTPPQPTTPPTQPTQATQPTTPPTQATQATEPTTQPTEPTAQPTTNQPTNQQPGSSVTRESWGPYFKIHFTASNNGSVKLYIEGGFNGIAWSWYSITGCSYDASTHILTIKVPTWAFFGADVGIVLPGLDASARVWVVD